MRAPKARLYGAQPPVRIAWNTPLPARQGRYLRMLVTYIDELFKFLPLIRTSFRFPYKGCN